MDNSKPDRDMQLLCPKFAFLLQKSVDLVNEQGYGVAVFETWRSPQRQEWLWSQGRSREGGVVTQARAWQSWHQFGLAADIAFFDNGVWSWKGDITKVVPFFKMNGLEWGGEKDAWHFQKTNGLNKDMAKNLYNQIGLQHVWKEVFK